MINDEQEPPVISNLPAELAIDETDDTGPTVIFSIDVYEPEGDVLNYDMKAYPDEGMFYIDQTSKI